MDDKTGSYKPIKNSQATNTVIRMEADLNNKTLHFWVNNEKVTESFCNVEGPVRWAACINGVSASIKVVPTEPTYKQSYRNPWKSLKAYGKKLESLWKEDGVKV